MSRDWTPKEMDIAHKQFPEMKQMLEKGNLTYTYNGETHEVYTDEDRENFKTFPHLSLCGLDFLMMCKNKGLLNNDSIELIKDVEKVINNIEIDDKEFEEKIKLWYEGSLEPGHYMENNNYALVEEIQKIRRYRE